MPVPVPVRRFHYAADGIIQPRGVVSEQRVVARGHTCESAMMKQISERFILSVITFCGSLYSTGSLNIALFIVFGPHSHKSPNQRRTIPVLLGDKGKCTRSFNRWWESKWRRHLRKFEFSNWLPGDIYRLSMNLVIERDRNHVLVDEISKLVRY